MKFIGECFSSGFRTNKGNAVELNVVFVFEGRILSWDSVLLMENQISRIIQVNKKPLRKHRSSFVCVGFCVLRGDAFLQRWVCLPVSCTVQSRAVKILQEDQLGLLKGGELTLRCGHSQPATRTMSAFTPQSSSPFPFCSAERQANEGSKLVVQLAARSR